MSKRITFDQHDAAHLYELALEHFCVEASTGDCHTCHNLKDRLEKFIGPSEVLAVHQTIRKNGYCNRLKRRK